MPTRSPLTRRGPRVAATLLLAVLASGCALFRPDPAVLARLDARLGELLLVGFAGTTLADNAELEGLVCATRAGAILLFGRNVTDSAQLAALTAAVRERGRACAGRPPLVAVDAEGGQVMRLGPRAGFPPALSAGELGDANDLAATELEARRIGALLRTHGIDWNLAPVVDVGYNPANPVIVGTDRSFGASPARVTAQARAWIAGMHAAGVLTALKHFPGHGSSYGDTHAGFVDVTDTADPDIELEPYRVLVRERVVDAVMTAHVFNRRLDAHLPATLSPATIGGLLRRDLAYDGVVVTDDLRMGAIEQHWGHGEAAVLALAAGVDVLLVADDRLPDGRSASDAVVAAIRHALARGRLEPARVEEALARIAALRTRVPAR